MAGLFLLALAIVLCDSFSVFFLSLFTFSFLLVSLFGVNRICVDLITPFLRHHLRHVRDSGDVWYHDRESRADHRGTKAAVPLE